MDIAKDKIFNIRYNAKLDKLEIAKESKIKKWCLQHKIMTAIIGTTILAIIVDFILVYQFVQVLCTL